MKSTTFEAQKRVKITKVECPKQLASLKGKQPRFTQVCEKSDMTKVVFDMLKI